MMGVKIIYQLKSQLKSDKKLTIIYPDSDGKPIADNTKQFRWIEEIKYQAIISSSYLSHGRSPTHKSAIIKSTKYDGK